MNVTIVALALYTYILQPQIHNSHVQMICGSSDSRIPRSHLLLTMMPQQNTWCSISAFVDTNEDA